MQDASEKVGAESLHALHAVPRMISKTLSWHQNKDDARLDDDHV